MLTWHRRRRCAGIYPPGQRHFISRWGFLLDSSGSITSGGWSTIVNGLANAIPQFLATSPTDQYQLSVMSFSSTTQTIVTPTIITAGNLATLQSQITFAPFLNANTNFNLASPI